MADRKSTDRAINADMKRASSLDRLASRLLQSVDPSYNDQRLMSDQDAEFNRIIDRQLDIAKGVAGGQVVDFIASLRKSQNQNRGGKPKNSLGIETADLFTENIGDIFGYFQDVYKNRYMEIADLKFISKFIPSIGEAVRIYLDAIVASDDVSQTITRNINMPGITDPQDKNTIMNRIEQMEEEYRLLPKLKVAYKKAMVTGSFFVWHIAYKELFEMYSQGLASGRILRSGPNTMNGNSREGTGSAAAPGMANAPAGKMPKANKANVLGIAQESTIVYDIKEEPGLEAFGEEMQFLARDELIYKCNLKGALESSMEEIKAMAESSGLPIDRDGNKKDGKKFANELVSAIEADMPNIYFLDSPIPFEVINDTSGIMEAGIESFHEFFNLRKDVDEKIGNADKTMVEGVDGAFNVNGENSTRAQKFNVTGTYLKWIDYKYMLPIEVLGHIIGYYHIVSTTKTKKKGGKGTANKSSEIGGILSSGSMSLFDQMDVSEKRKEAAIQNIVDTISDAILTQFGTKFVKKNAAFRQLISECIIANGLVNNDFMIQFIPANQVIEFKCNEDENGKGESILSEAMFPAHLLLSMVVSKMLNYINKGGNRTIAHISSGRVNRNLGNQVNRVIRDLQAGNVTFTDLLSSSMVFNKVTRDSNIAMPKDQAGNRLVEFEVQEGQQIELNTDYETMLERWCMTATGIPPTVMDYQSDVNVAKKVVSDNVRVAGRVASMQSDLEGPTTQLYRVLIADSDIDDATKNLLSTMTFKLPRPRILANQNNSEALNTAYSNAQTIANIKLGDNDNTDDERLVRSKLIELIARNETPFINWNEIDELEKKVRADIAGDKTKKNAEKNLNGGTDMENPDDSLDGLGGF